MELRFKDVFMFMFPFFCGILKELLYVYVEHEYIIDSIAIETYKLNLAK